MLCVSLLTGGAEVNVKNTKVQKPKKNPEKHEKGDENKKCEQLEGGTERSDSISLKPRCTCDEDKQLLAATQLRRGLPEAQNAKITCWTTASCLRVQAKSLESLRATLEGFTVANKANRPFSWPKP